MRSIRQVTKFHHSARETTMIASTRKSRHQERSVHADGKSLIPICWEQPVFASSRHWQSRRCQEHTRRTSVVSFLKSHRWNLFIQNSTFITGKWERGTGTETVHNGRCATTVQEETGVGPSEDDSSNLDASLGCSCSYQVVYELQVFPKCVARSYS